MLEQILAMLEASSSGLTASEVAAQMRRSPEAVAGMLHLLVSHGQVELRARSAACESCPIAAFCGPGQCSGEIYVSLRERDATDRTYGWLG